MNYQARFNKNLKRANQIAKEISVATIKGDDNKVKSLRVELKSIKL